MTKYLATDLVVGTLVGISLLMCICFGETSLAGNIASGLIGYLGRTITAGQTGGTAAKREDGANGSNQQKQPA